MSRFWIGCLAGVALLLGCGSPAQRMVGTWKGELKAKSSSDSLADGIRSFVSGIVGPLTYEFNDQGRYKMTIRLANQEGKYTVSGNEVHLESDDGKNHTTLLISNDGKSLSLKKEFKSDEDLVLTKQAE